MKVFTAFLAVFFMGIFAQVTDAQAADNSVFVYCSEGSPSSFNHQLATDGTTFNVTKPIYNRLVEFKYGETTIVPGLAEKWTISKDGLKFTFKLRKNVKWHETTYFKPTRDLNADDVLFTFNRMRDPNHPYNKVGGGNYEYFQSMEMDKIIKDIKKLDDNTVEFDLSTPEAPFLANLAMDFAGVLSAEYGDKLAKENKKDNIDSYPVGTGPWVFQSYVKDAMIRFVSNEKYFMAPPKIKKLVFAITPDASVRYQKLKTGECNFITYPAPADLDAMKKDANLKVMEKPGLNVGYLAFNVEKKPFDNKLVRQAISYALNRKSYIKAIYLDQAVIAKNPIPSTQWSYNNAVKDYEYNPEKAKELLKKAGFANGFETDLWTLPVSRPYNPNGKKMGEMMQGDLAKVGIKAKLVSYDWPTFLAKTKVGEHQMMQMGWTGDNGDPDNFLFVNLSCSAVAGGANRARWCFKPFDDLVTKAKQTMNQAARTLLYQDSQKVFKEEAPWVTIAHAEVYRAMRKNVQGYKIDPFGADFFYEVEVK